MNSLLIMPQKKSGKRLKKEESAPKKESAESSGLETELENKEISAKELAPENDKESDMDFNGIDFSRELAQVLRFQASADSMNLETMNLGSDLEGAVFFAPRILEKEEVKGKNYSDVKYDSNMYDKNNYSEQTPGVYSEKPGTSNAEGNSLADSESGNPGRGQ